MNSLVFALEDYSRLRNSLLAHAPNEAAAILLAGHSSANGTTKLFIREVAQVPDDAYLVQHTDQLEIQPVFIARHLKKARDEDLSLVLAHSHPFKGRVAFSRADDRGEGILMPTLFQRAPSRPHGALVIGPEGFCSRVRLSVEQVQAISALYEVGSRIKAYANRASAPIPEDFDRNVRAFGSEGQNALRSATVGIVGLGGTGSIVAEYLAHLGVGRLILLDPDKIERTNLNRVVGASIEDIGSYKVQVAAKHINRIRNDIDVVPIQGSVNHAWEARALLAGDLIVCCTDSQGSRAVLNQLAYQYYLPVVDLGVRIDANKEQIESIVGRVQLLAPGLPCLQCHNLLDPEAVRRDLLSDEERKLDPYIVGHAEPQPAVISINGVVASLAVTMVLSIITGLPDAARHQLYLAHQGVVRSIQSRSNPTCVVCSLKGALGRGDTWPLPWRRA